LIESITVPPAGRRADGQCRRGRSVPWQGEAGQPRRLRVPHCRLGHPALRPPGADLCAPPASQLVL